MTFEEIMKWLKANGSKEIAEGMKRYAIETKAKVYGHKVGSLRALAKKVGKDHALALKLFATDCYEAQILAPMVDDPKLVTKAQMNKWASEFDNWATCDTACFVLFDKAEHAWDRARVWAISKKEFVKRSAFALMASLTIHDKKAEDARYLDFLPLIEAGACDERNFVKKSVNWALRSIGKRSLELNAAALEVALRLKARSDSPSRWVGSDAARELASPSIQQRLQRKQAKVAAPKKRATKR